MTAENTENVASVQLCQTWADTKGVGDATKLVVHLISLVQSLLNEARKAFCKASHSLLGSERTLE